MYDVWVTHYYSKCFCVNADDKVSAGRMVDELLDNENIAGFIVGEYQYCGTDLDVEDIED